MDLLSLNDVPYVLAFPYSELFTSVSRQKKKYQSSFNNNNDNKNVIRRINTIKIFIQHVLHFARWTYLLIIFHLVRPFSREDCPYPSRRIGESSCDKKEGRRSFLPRRGYDGAGIYIYIYTRGSSIEEEAREGIILARIELSWPSFKFVLNSHENSFSNALSRSSRRGSISFPLARSTKSGFEDLRGPFEERQETGIVLSFRGNFCPNEGFLIGLAK